MTMRAGFPRIRRLCFSAVFSLAAFGALGQSNEVSLGQRNPACGSPASLDDGWATASPEWWMGRSLSNGKEVKWVAAVGWGGQRIFVVPDLDLVVMTTSGLFGKPTEGLGALDILTNSVIPSVRDKNNTR